MPASLVDTDILLEIIKGRNPFVIEHARLYLQVHGRFIFSIITYYEILRGFKVRASTNQIAEFERLCAQSMILPITEPIVTQAAEMYAYLYQRGELIPDADLLIGATAIVHGLVLISRNRNHFERLPGLVILDWTSQ